MMMQKKTNLGTLTARYKHDEIYPGFWIDLRQKDGELINNYYKDGSSEEMHESNT